MINKKIILLLGVLLCWPVLAQAAFIDVSPLGCPVRLTCSVSGKTLSCSNTQGSGGCFWYVANASDNSRLRTGIFGDVFNFVSFTSGVTGSLSNSYHVCATGGSPSVRECWWVVAGDVSLLYIGVDPDNDGQGSATDNCPTTANTDQKNTDGDSQGDACDTDDDNDGVLDTSDNCSLNANPDQLNTDGDAQGNTCDTDDDNDGVSDGSDKFPLDPTETIDTDNDGIGNNADLDDDGDGVADASDNCPMSANGDQLNTDGDAYGNVCDWDVDGDGVGDFDDSFPLDPAESLDTDNDGIGNNADTDDDGDSVQDVADNCPLDPYPDQLDDDHDGSGNFCDSDGPGKPDASFNPGSINSYVYAVAVQVDGNVLIGGSFTSASGVPLKYVARLNSDGSLDSTFNPVSGINNYVYALAAQPDGKVLVGGKFTSFQGVGYNHIARLNNDGSLDASFNPGTGASGDVYTVALQADGKVLIAGGFSTVNGVARSYLARLNSDGSLDTTFNFILNSSAAAIVIQEDGKTLIGGGFTTVNGATHNRLVRLNSDDSLDASFNVGVGPNGSVASIAVQPDGKLLIAGSFTTVNGTVRNGLARLNGDGSLDASFDSGAGPNVIIVEGVVAQADGKVLIVGDFTVVNGVARNRIARLNSDGTVDVGFNPGTGINSYVNAMVLQLDGKVLVGGRFSNVNGVNMQHIARIHTGDADNDGIENAADFDFDNDGVVNAQDTFPFDPTESLDTDNDGIGNNADLDDDGDGVPDYIDAAPLNAANTSEVTLPLNSGYKGSAVTEQVAPQ